MQPRRRFFPRGIFFTIFVPAGKKGVFFFPGMGYNK